jgi:hypothetical protein
MGCAMFIRKLLLVTLAVSAFLFGGKTRAQGTAPLHLFINGAGSVSPFHDGQLLEVGLSYDMVAVPDSGSAFSSWQPVNVFGFITRVIDAGGTVQTNISVVSSPVAEYFTTPTLSFTLAPEELLSDTPAITVTKAGGWQANFEAVPEPASMALLLCGVAATGLFQRRPAAKATPGSCVRDHDWREKSPRSWWPYPGRRGR